jgi:hypothetical protein
MEVISEVVQTFEHSIDRAKDFSAIQLQNATSKVFPNHPTRIHQRRKQRSAIYFTQSEVPSVPKHDSRFTEPQRRFQPSLFANARSESSDDVLGGIRLAGGARFLCEKDEERRGGQRHCPICGLMDDLRATCRALWRYRAQNEIACREDDREGRNDAIFAVIVVCAQMMAPS